MSENRPFWEVGAIACLRARTRLAFRYLFVCLCHSPSYSRARSFPPFSLSAPFYACISAIFAHAFL